MSFDRISSFFSSFDTSERSNDRVRVEIPSGQTFSNLFNDRFFDCVPFLGRFCSFGTSVPEHPWNRDGQSC